MCYRFNSGEKCKEKKSKYKHVRHLFLPQACAPRMYFEEQARPREGHSGGRNGQEQPEDG